MTRMKRATATAPRFLPRRAAKAPQLWETGHVQPFNIL